MTTLAAAKARSYSNAIPPVLNAMDMIASDIVYQGAAVGESGTTGTFRPLVAGDRFAGFATQTVDNSSGSASAKTVQVRQMGEVQIPVTGASGTADVGAPVFATDDDTFTLASAFGSYIGNITRHVSSTTCEVFFVAEALRESTRIVRQTSAELDHAAFTDNADATGEIDTGIDIPANSLLLGFEINVTEGFAGDTTAVADLGTSVTGGDPDLFNGAIQPNVLAIAKVGVGATPAGAYVAAATDLYLTVESATDFSSVSAGKAFVTALYVRL